MKAIKMMMFVAAAAMLFASCGKDELDLENNQLRYDGTVCNMTTSAMTDTQDSYVSFGGVGKEVLFQLNGLFEEAAFNRTFDLAVAAEDVHYNIDMMCEAWGLNFSYDNNHGRFYGGMEGVTQGESIFSEGTCTVTYDNDGFTVTLDGTLKNGKELAFKLYVPRNELQVY